ncbi:MAG: ATP-binding cassette domain-containing protein, partial [Clostridia bacterium]
MAETQKKVLLSITNLQKYFPIKNGKLFSHEHLFVRANEDISLNIYEGETFGLVGESGCGKSTFGRVLLQLYAQTDGRTMYYGRTLDDLTPRYIPKLLHHLEHEIKRQQKLEAHRQTLEAQYNALPDDAARWAMHGKLT